MRPDSRLSTVADRALVAGSNLPLYCTFIFMDQPCPCFSLIPFRIILLDPLPTPPDLYCLFNSMAAAHSGFKAFHERYPVKLEAKEDQQTLYSNSEAVGLDFGDGSVKTLCYIPQAVAEGKIRAHDVLWVHFHGGGLVSHLSMVNCVY